MPMPVASPPPSKFGNHPFPLYEFLKNAVKNDKESFIKDNIRILAEVSPSFKKFIEEIK